MAGKFEYRGYYRLTRAYASGREAAFTGGSNPHVSGSPAHTAWAAGNAATGVDSTARSGTAAGLTWTYNGSNYLNRGGALTGAANKFYATLAFKIRPAAVSAIQNAAFFGAANNRVFIAATTGAVTASLTVGATAVGGTTASGLSTSADSIVVIHWFGDPLVATNGGLRVWINGVLDLDSGGTSLEADGRLGIGSSPQFAIGASNAGAGPILSGGRMSWIWYHASDTLSEGNPAAALFNGSLGADGSTPSGVQPLVFFGQSQTLAGVNAGTNLGTGGAFTRSGSAFT